MDTLECGTFNCDITSNFTDYSGFQKFDCCHPGKYANTNKKKPVL